MDKLEAKLILANVTLGAEPVGDPRLEEAVRLAESDPELMAWWRRTKESDLTIQGSLLDFEPPADLLPALKASMESVSKWQTIRRRTLQYLALAASLALIGHLLFTYVPDRSDDYTGPLVERAYNYSVDGPRLSYFDKNTTKITDWLEEQGFDLPERLPPKLLAHEGIGCRSLGWAENKVALICVDADVVYHLFVARGEDFDSLELSKTFEYEEREAGWTVGKWKSQGHLFVLTAKASLADMETMLAEYTP